MIQLSNGHNFEFACASGAMAYLHGWWWEQPFRWVGMLDPYQFTIITKTLTLERTVGNLNLWLPWRCVCLLSNGSAVNTVGLTNPGLYHWCERYYPQVVRRGYKVIVSVMPKTPDEAKVMASYLEAQCKEIKGIELNVSCPNTTHDSLEHVIGLVKAITSNTSHPLIVKLGADSTRFCLELDGMVEAFDLINTVPWKLVWPQKKSPLKGGGVSGRAIKSYARVALEDAIKAGIHTPIISGGGIDSVREVYERKRRGAKAFTFGTLFIYQPWKPNQIIRQIS